MTESEKLNNEQLLRINGKELTLLDELMNKEMKRMDQPGISESEKREIEDQFETLLKISKIVSAEEKQMSDENRKGLSCVAERLLEDSASAHLRTDADGHIHLIITDPIHEPRLLAELEMSKVMDSVFFLKFNYFG